ncbi:unnamed protein product [Fusarium graminearum]|uniref:Zn(2)-C6 fungal-type domain-containing protein n=1 Tax=Gibberella zeae TaxID=5518 RepID=A0A9N8WY27_GIBZA|nr:unnamed protein product [Fusarium graminearum]CAG2002417.1 unnamed protein product [Fusarium graminearum]
MPLDINESDPSGPPESSKTEPLACVSCRARKLKCDRIKPACARCVKVSNDCVYPESRRKPNFKRRNVKELEARLAQVEDYLKEVNKNSSEEKTDDGSPIYPNQHHADFGGVVSPGIPGLVNDFSDPSLSSFPPSAFDQQSNDVNPSFDAQLMSLGMSEPLPPDDVMEELNNIFFQNQYRLIPIVHPGRYLQSFYGPMPRRPPMCLRYAIWALAAAGNVKYDEYHDIFYRRSRQYMEADTMKGHGEVFISIQHAQTWALVAFYEAKMLLFTRSTISVANCVRLCHMMGLNRLDGDNVGMPPSLGPPITWAELEERRRIFWGVFAADSHCCISTGWPTLIDSDDIATRLPASEEAFVQDRKEEAPFLDDAIQGAQYTGFAGTIVTCQINKLVLRHIHRSKPDSRCEDLMNGSFWTRHRDLDNTLSSLFMFLPENFRLPENIRDVSALHLNMNLHAAIICIHHAAVEKAERYKLPGHVKQGSVARLRAAAEEIANLMRLTSNVTLFFKSPLSALSLYCAATVYIYLAKESPATGLNAMDVSNFQLIIQCMEAIARVHTITRSFLHQTCVDIEKIGLDSVIQMPSLRRYRDTFGPSKSQIPILARTPVSNHSGPSPIVSRSEKQLEAEQTRLNNITHLMGVTVGKTCYQALLGSAYRNIRPDPMNNKRKRAGESPAPTSVPSMRNNNALDLNLDHNFKGTGMWSASFSPQITTLGGISLPDRTNSSTASSPVNQVSNSGSYTRTASGSSHTSPDIGLGNTAEENRIDLRAFQDRISTPIWQSTEETLFAQMATNTLGTDGADTWGILTAVDLSWDAEGLSAERFVAFLVVFSNPIGDFFYPNRAAQVKDASPRPKLNESLLAIDAPNATAPECAPDGYLARIVSREPLIVYLEGFLNQEEREHLLDISEPIFVPSTITSNGEATHRDASVRDSDVAVIPRTDSVRCIESRTRALQGWRPELWIERLRTQRYGPGGHYNHHFDWSHNSRGWGRVSSLMAWVGGSDDLKGGGTEFPLVKRPVEKEWCRFIECGDGGEDKSEVGVVFKVLPGNAVYWENFAADGRGYDETWHAGLPVDKGTKVGLNIWSFGRI